LFAIKSIKKQNKNLSQKKQNKTKQKKNSHNNGKTGLDFYISVMPDKPYPAHLPFSVLSAVTTRFFMRSSAARLTYVRWGLFVGKVPDESVKYPLGTGKQNAFFSC